MKSGNVNFLEPTGALHAWDGTDVPFFLRSERTEFRVYEGAVLQIGRPLVRFQMLSLEFFIEIILQIALRP